MVACPQIQELSHKLEKVAKQQKMEDELEALSRHHVKIRALKSSLSKLTAKCHAEMDESSNESVHRVAGMILDLSEKLAVQVCRKFSITQFLFKSFDPLIIIRCSSLALEP